MQARADSNVLVILQASVQDFVSVMNRDRSFDTEYRFMQNEIVEVQPQMNQRYVDCRFQVTDQDFINYFHEIANSATDPALKMQAQDVAIQIELFILDMRIYNLENEKSFQFCINGGVNQDDSTDYNFTLLHTMGENTAEAFLFSFNQYYPSL